MFRNKGKGFFIRALVSLGLLFLMLYANFYTIRKMERYAVEAFFYQRLSAAYDIGQADGLHRELAKISADAGAPGQAALAREFAGKLGSIKNPELYIENALQQKKTILGHLKNYRQIAIVLLLVLVLLRIFLNRRKNRGV